MYSQTKGIVLSSVKYSETSIISKIYTAEMGLQSYIANGVRKKNGGKAYYQPLNIVELTAYCKKHGGLHRIKEIKIPTTYCSIPYNLLKSSVALFLSEVLIKCLKEEERNEDLFNFLECSLIDFDRNDFNEQFHIQFLIGLSYFLGFFPNMEKSNLQYFDLINGCFSDNKNGHKHFIDNSEDLLSALKLKPVKNKRAILNYILMYYQIHVEGFGNIKSKNVLKKVLR